jgi:hypothetical protein
VWIVSIVYTFFFFNIRDLLPMSFGNQGSRVLELVLL